MLSKSIWKRDEMQSWLLTCAEKVLSFYSNYTSPLGIEHQKAYYKHLNDNESIQKYLKAVEEDFQDEFNRLPPDANPLDPRLADPRMLLANQPQIRRLREQFNQQFNQFDQLGNNALDEEALLAELERLREQGINIEFDQLVDMVRHGQQNFNIDHNGNVVVNNNLNPRQVSRGNLDPNLPLLQLFLQTFLPWNSIDESLLNNRNEND